MPSVKEEIEDFKKQGYDEPQIREYLVQKGYTPTQINSLIDEEEKEINKKKIKEKRMIVNLSILLFFVILGNMFYFYFTTTELYSNNPKKWIEEGPTSNVINVEKATKGGSYVDQIGEQQYKEIGTMFSSEGWYKGVYFIKEYSDEKGIVKMRITTNLDPENGILEGYLVERLEDDNLYAYIFLDEDWKRKFPNAMIYWGESYQHNQSFDFTNKVKEGIYLTKVKDDNERFLLDYSIHKGGFYIGDLRDNEFSTIISYN